MFVTFRNNLFNDQTKDPHLGIYHNLYTTFDVDPNNQNAGPQPAAIRDLIAAAGYGFNPLALGIIHAPNSSHQSMENFTHLMATYTGTKE